MAEANCLQLKEEEVGWFVYHSFLLMVLHNCVQVDDASFDLVLTLKNELYRFPRTNTFLKIDMLFEGLTL